MKMTSSRKMNTVLSPRRLLSALLLCIILCTFIGGQKEHIPNFRTESASAASEAKLAPSERVLFPIEITKEASGVRTLEAEERKESRLSVDRKTVPDRTLPLLTVHGFRPVLKNSFSLFFLTNRISSRLVIIRYLRHKQGIKSH